MQAVLARQQPSSSSAANARGISLKIQTHPRLNGTIITVRDKASKNRRPIPSSARGTATRIYISFLSNSNRSGTLGQRGASCGFADGESSRLSQSSRRHWTACC